MTAPGLVAIPAADTRRTLAERLRALPMPSERLVVVALAALVLVVAILTVTPWPVGAFQDDAMYVVLAKSLATGQGFRFINLPGAPHGTHFPPGYPLLLAGLWKLWPSFPDNIVLFKFANAALLAIAALGAYRFTRVRFHAPVPVATGVAVIGTLSIVILLVTGVVMSEPMFMALLFPALLWTERAVDEGRVRDAVVAGLLLGALTMVRTLGAFAIPAAGLVLLSRRKVVPALALGAAAALFVVPWQLWVSAYQGEVPRVFVGKYGSYGGWLAEGYRQGGLDFAFDVVKKNATELHGMLSYYFMPLPQGWPRAVVMAGVLAFALLGTRRFLRNAPASLGFLVLYTFVVMVWPFEPARFVLAVWPLWPLLVGSGVVAAWQLAGGPLAVRAVVVAMVAAFVAGSGWYNAVGYSRKWWVSVQRDAGQRAKPIVEWAARNTDATTVLSTEDDLIVYLYADRLAVPTSTFIASQRVRALTDAEDAAWVREIFDTYHPGWFIVGSAQGERTATNFTTGPRPRLRLVGRTRDVLIYQLP